MKVCFIIDDIADFNYEKDSTLAMMWEAQDRGWKIYTLQPQDIFLQDGQVAAKATETRVFKDHKQWFQLLDDWVISLGDFDVVFMRKDPPFDLAYVYSTYLLEMAQAQGAKVVNDPRSLRDCNEKLFAQWFPQCCPPTAVAASAAVLRNFINEHKKAILKPLSGMGGASIFYLEENDPNISVVIENLTLHGRLPIMAQQFIPDIKKGDKRILMINGEPVPFALARIPAKGSLRGNLAAGATGKAIKLSKQDQRICEQVGPTLREKGLLFVGLDVIGDYLTEINVTSPTCIRELDQQCGLNIAAELLDMVS